VATKLSYMRLLVLLGPLLGCFVILTGCTVNVQGRKRPLVRYEPIQGELELVAETRTDSQRTGGAERRSKAYAFEERVKLRTQGDVYHPKLLAYAFALGPALTQQSLSVDDDSGRADGCLNDYSLSVQLLQAKPYPIAFHTGKSEGLVPRQFLGALKTESENTGASLAIRSEDWPMQFQYSTGRIRQDALAPIASDSFVRDDERFTYSVDHDFSRLSHLRFEFNKNKIVNLSTVGTATIIQDDRYNALHDWVFGSEEQHRLDSLFEFLDKSGTSNLDQTRWDERLKLRHTSNFQTHYSFGLTDGRRETSRSTQLRGRAGFEHWLYESLITSGHIFGSDSDIGNDAHRSEKGGLLAFDYRKKNPWGRLESRYSIGLARLEQTGTGTAIVVDEPHVFIDPLPITLNNVNVDTSTIVVTDGTGTTVYLVNADYIVTEIDNRVQLEINPFGPGGITDGQTLLVDYNFFTEPERQQDTRSQVLTVTQLFNNGLSLYYWYTRQDQDVLSTIPSELPPDRFRSHIYGASYTRGGLLLEAELSERKSTRSPSTGVRVKGGYSWIINPDTKADVWASNDWRNFGEPDDRDTRVFRSGGGIFTRLTRRTTAFASAAYRDETDSRFGDTKGIQLNSELKYVRRQIELSAGVQYGELDRRGSETDNTFLYVRFTRQL
jgi:hypothetical protein